jgi:3-oxoadipate enol-lactonase
MQKLFIEHAKEISGLTRQEKLMFLYGHMFYNLEILNANPGLLKSTLTPHQSAAANKALERFDFRPRLPEITAETLVISGKYDGLNPSAEGKLCASLIPKATFVEMPYSGHFPMLEESEAYSRLIDSFLLSGKN